MWVFFDRVDFCHACCCCSSPPLLDFAWYEINWLVLIVSQDLGFCFISSVVATCHQVTSNVQWPYQWITSKTPCNKPCCSAPSNTRPCLPSPSPPISYSVHSYSTSQWHSVGVAIACPNEDTLLFRLHPLLCYVKVFRLLFHCDPEYCFKFSKRPWEISCLIYVLQDQDSAWCSKVPMTIKGNIKVAL